MLCRYFLSYSKLARVSMVFWGHAITSGVLVCKDDFNTENASSGTSNCDQGPDYFISSELFENSNHIVAQSKYTERLILQKVRMLKYLIFKVRSE